MAPNQVAGGGNGTGGSRGGEPAWRRRDHGARAGVGRGEHAQGSSFGRWRGADRQEGRLDGQSDHCRAGASIFCPTQEVKNPEKGLLYFSIDRKLKPKDLSLIYDGEGGKLVVDFKYPAGYQLRV